MPRSLRYIPLPCWKDLPPEAYRARIAGLVEKIEADAAALREQTGRQPHAQVPLESKAR